MKEHIFRGKRVDNNEWVRGSYVRAHKYLGGATGHFIYDIYGERRVLVVPDTVSEFTGLCDKNGKRIFDGDIVKFCGIVGEVVFEKGAFGIGTHETIDYDLLEKEMRSLNSDNSPEFCGNDNFISLWEIWWNFEIEDEQLDVVEVIGNKWDNPELLKGGAV